MKLHILSDLHIEFGMLELSETDADVEILALKLAFVGGWPGGDYTGEGHVNIGDFAYWPDCMSGPAVGYAAPQCQAFDFDLDGDVDLVDFGGFQSVFTGPAR